MANPDLGIATFASCTVEVHALTLGLALGGVLSLAILAGYDRLAIAILAAVVIPSVYGVPLHPVVEMKPWYLVAPAMSLPATMVSYMLFSQKSRDRLYIMNRGV